MTKESIKEYSGIPHVFDDYGFEYIRRANVDILVDKMFDYFIKIEVQNTKEYAELVNKLENQDKNTAILEAIIRQRKREFDKLEDELNIYKKK